jgi:hypothetical protein
MQEQNQASDDQRPGAPAEPGAPGESEPARDPAPAPGPAFPAPGDHAWAEDPVERRARRGLLAWFFALIVLGIAGLAAGQTEAAALVALATLFAAAQAADVDDRSRLSYRLVAWVVPTTAVATFGALTYLLVQSPLAGPARIVAVGSAVTATLLSALLALPEAAERLARALMRVTSSTHVQRLTARLATYGLLLALPVWFQFDVMRESLLENPKALLDPSHLSGGVLGYVLLALGGVGWLVRRDLRGTLERLGILGLARRDALILPLGVAALVALNAGGDALQHALVPALWARDHEFTRVLARSLAPAQAVLLGVSAGVGEEITLRGALQPRLGLALTSLLFAALHVQYSWFGMIMILLLGLTLGLIRQKSSTTVAILTHALYDVMAVVAE